MALLGQGFEDPRSAAIMALAGGLLKGDFGGGLLGANQAYGQAVDRQRAAKEAEMQGLLRNMQIKNYESEIAARGLAAENEKRNQDTIDRILSGASAAPGQLGSGSFGIVPPAQGQPAIPEPSNVMQRLTPDSLAALKRAGLDLTDVYKLANVPTSISAGSYAFLPGQQPKYMNDPTKGMAFDGGRVTGIPGFAETNAGIKGAETAAVEAAKARQDLVTVTDEKTGIPYFVPKSSITMPQQSPQVGNPSMQVTPQQQRGADVERIRTLQNELRKPGLPPADRQAITNELQRTITAQTSPGFPQSLGVQAGLSPAQITANKVAETKAVEQAKADIKPTAQRESAIAAGNYMSNLLDRAIAHPGLNTATGLSGTFDPRNYLPGTNATNFRVMLDQIKGSAFLQAFESLKGGGQITEVEGKKATDAIARLNTAQSDKEFKSALQEFKSVIDAANQRMQGGAKPKTGGIAPYSDPEKERRYQEWKGRNAG